MSFIQYSKASKVARETCDFLDLSGAHTHPGVLGGGEDVRGGGGEPHPLRRKMYTTSIKI